MANGIGIENSFKLDSITFYTSTGSTANLNETLFGGGDVPIRISAITSDTFALNSISQADDSGGLYDEFRVITSQQPVNSFTTKDIRTLLQATNVYGACISESAPNGMNLYMAQTDPCIGRKARNTASHARYNIPAGTLVPDTIVANTGVDAEMSAMMHSMVLSSELEPMNWVFNSQLPLAGAFPETFASGQWTLGACSLAFDEDCNQEPDTGGAFWVLDDLSGVTINFGVQIYKRPTPASIWPQIVTIEKIQPTITFNSVNLRVFNQTPPGVKLLGSFLMHDDVNPQGPYETIIQLRKRAQCSDTAIAQGFEPDADPVHINIRAQGFMHAISPVSAAGSQDANISLQMDCTDTLNVGQALFRTVDTTYDRTPSQ